MNLIRSYDVAHGRIYCSHCQCSIDYETSPSLVNDMKTARFALSEHYRLYPNCLMAETHSQ